MITATPARAASTEPRMSGVAGIDRIIIVVPGRGDGLRAPDRGDRVGAPDHAHDHAAPVRRELGAPAANTQAVGDAKRAVDEVVRYYRSIGITAAEGAEQIDVSFDPTYPNAHYDLGRDEMVIGADPRTGRSFADAKDVVAHELGHRIALRTGLISRSGNDRAHENAALQEHVADVFAAAFDQDDWIIGEDLGQPIRNMANPRRLGHPATMEEANRGLESGSLVVPEQLPDGRTVGLPNWHAIAEVPNRAASMIGDAIGRDNLAKLYVETLRSHATPKMTMGGFAKAVTQTAQDLYGAGAPEVRATLDAYRAVGLLSTGERRDARS